MEAALDGQSLGYPAPRSPAGPHNVCPSVRGTRAVVHRPRDMTWEVLGAEALDHRTGGLRVWGTWGRVT